MNEPNKHNMISLNFVTVNKQQWLMFQLFVEQQDFNPSTSYVTYNLGEMMGMLLVGRWLMVCEVGHVMRPLSCLFIMNNTTSR